MQRRVFAHGGWLLIIALLLLLVACGEQPAEPGGGAIPGGEAEPTVEPGVEMPAGGEAEVIMQNIAFQPQEITVQPGTTVTWINQDSVPHTVTAGTRENPTGMFDSGNIPPDGTFQFTFEEPGTYDYFCSIHEGMDGVVVVEQQ